MSPPKTFNMREMNEKVTFYPAIQNMNGQQVPDYENAVDYMCKVTYENHWEIDSNNVNQFNIELKLIIPADSLVVEGWRVLYDANEYTVWKVKDVKTPTGRMMYRVVDSG